MTGKEAAKSALALVFQANTDAKTRKLQCDEIRFVQERITHVSMTKDFGVSDMWLDGVWDGALEHLKQVEDSNDYLDGYIFGGQLWDRYGDKVVVPVYRAVELTRDVEHRLLAELIDDKLIMLIDMTGYVVGYMKKDKVDEFTGKER